MHPQRPFRLTLTGTGDGQGAWDRDRMAQTLGNLLNNAITHGADGTPIDVVLHAEPDRLRIAITNQGPPIPTAEIGSLFDPYRRGKGKGPGTTPSGGVGLGLYIAREIIAAHGGTIDVESAAASGTLTPRHAPAPS